MPHIPFFSFKNSQSPLDSIRERYSAFKKKVDHYFYWGWGLIILGGVNLIDAGSPFPIPLVGRAAIIVSVALIGIGIYLVNQYNKMLVPEAVNSACLLAQDKTGGFLTIQIFIRYLSLNFQEAAQLIKHMHEQGIGEIVGGITEENRDKPALWLFHVYTIDPKKASETMPGEGQQPQEQSEAQAQSEGRTLTASEVNEMVLGNQVPPTRKGIPLSERLQSGQKDPKK